MQTPSTIFFTLLLIAAIIVLRADMEKTKRGAGGLQRSHHTATLSEGRAKTKDNLNQLYTLQI